MPPRDSGASALGEQTPEFQLGEQVTPSFTQILPTAIDWLKGRMSRGRCDCTLENIDQVKVD